jgi:hypothetical protein
MSSNTTCLATSLSIQQSLLPVQILCSGHNATDHLRENLTAAIPVRLMNTLQKVGFENLTAVTIKNAVSWDIKTQFVPHKKHITSPQQSPAG